MHHRNSTCKVAIDLPETMWNWTFFVFAFDQIASIMQCNNGMFRQHRVISHRSSKTITISSSSSSLIAFQTAVPVRRQLAQFRRIQAVRPVHQAILDQWSQSKPMAINWRHKMLQWWQMHRPLAAINEKRYMRPQRTPSIIVQIIGKLVDKSIDL